MLSLKNFIFLISILFLFSVTSVTIVFSEDDVDLLLKNGLESYRDGKLEESMAYFDKVLKIEPNNLDALNNKGGLLNTQGDFYEALVYFDRVLEIEPNYVRALVNKGSTLGSLGKFDEAIFSLERALEIDPENIDALSNKAAVFVDQEQHYDAITIFHNLLKIDPDNEIAKEYLPKAKSGLGYGRVDGFAEFVLRNEEGQLITYFKSPYLAVLNHDLGLDYINSFRVIGNIFVNNTHYDVLQKEFFGTYERETVFARTIAYNAEDPDIHLMYSPNWGFPVEIGDTIDLLYTIYKPIE